MDQLILTRKASPKKALVIKAHMVNDYVLKPGGALSG